MAFDAIARREEGVEALNERGMVAEEGRDAVDDAGRIDAAKEATVRPVLSDEHVGAKRTSGS